LNSGWLALSHFLNLHFFRRSGFCAIVPNGWRVMTVPDKGQTIARAWEKVNKNQGSMQTRIAGIGFTRVLAAGHYFKRNE